MTDRPSLRRRVNAPPSRQAIQPALPSVASKEREVIQFRVRGDPRPQGALVVSPARNGGRPHLYHRDEAGLRAWRTAIATEARALAPLVPWKGPVEVMVTFYLPRPGRVPKERSGFPSARPDVDKLVRAMLDALTPVVFDDDAQVVELDARKLYATAVEAPGAVVFVTKVKKYDDDAGEGEP